MRANDDVPSRSARYPRLKKRAEFLRVGKGLRWHGKAMTIQSEARALDVGGLVDDGTPRFGFTLSKKVGNAVVRNRARRRLREAVRLAPDMPAKDGHDYVIVGRVEAVRLPFAALGRELARGVVAVHERGKRRNVAFEPRKTAKSPGRSAPERIRPVS